MRVGYPAWSHTFMEIDHEIFSTIFLLLPLIQEGRFSVPGESVHLVLVNSLGLSLPRKGVVKLMTAPDISLMGLKGCKTPKTNKT